VVFIQNTTGPWLLERIKITWFHIILVLSLIDITSQIASAQQTKKPFTVADEIGLTLFNHPGGGRAEVLFSPDGNYFAVWSERGRLDLNRVEDSLRFYRRQDVEAFLKHSDMPQPPSPVLVVDRSDISGGAIGYARWLPDSSGLAFAGHTNGGNQLLLADLRTETVEPLTSATEEVGTFDVRDREHYVYTDFDRAEREGLQQKTATEPLAAATIGTGHSLFELLLPDDYRRHWTQPRSHLWAVTSGKRLEVTQDAAPVDPGEFVVSPDGSSLVTTLPVREAPSSWETLYAPPYASSPFRIRRNELAHQYVKIELKTGSIQSLTDAPKGRDAGWDTGEPRPSWSSDGLAVLLPDTFLSSKDHTPSSPCVAVVDFPSATRTCVATLKGQTDDKGYHSLQVIEAHFAGGNKDRVIVTTHGGSDHTAEYRRTGGSTWQDVVEGKRKSIEDEPKDLEVIVKEGLDQAPLLVVKNKQTSRVLWDPNPQLDNIELGRASVYRWKDKKGREWEGGLYKPADYKPGERYPLVIQTHGFREFEFRPSGLFPTGSAARALAAAGIFVLQVGEHCPIQMLSEGPCAASAYESAVDQLVSEGVVDPERIGIIGFSRSCYWVMEALTASSVHFKAALVTDGWMMTYLQYIMTIDLRENAVPRQFESVIGAPPFGENLQRWLKRSPAFNLDKITAPLLVVAAGRSNLMVMWEPYAGLRYLHKPTELVLLNTDEHVLTNPAVRLASQGGSVDWFRFWLKDEEDSDPDKAKQYARWHKLRDSCAIDCRAQSR